ncbi:Zinc finger MYM-type protein [Arachis hypogaea]|nr:Zinc finger MYM-type protein [Arachis hypogaea]
MIKLIASYNDEVARTVLENAPYNAKYTSHQIQKEILHILSNKVRKHICEEIGDSKFCIVVDEARDESKREQMALVLRFVDIHGFIQERFLDLVHVKDTTSLTLKQELCGILSRHGLDVPNIRGQGYDGASNMRGEWNGLQALFLKDCPYAYYIHCFAHRLQLALVAASREVIPVHQFFSKLTFIVNIICSSSKRHDELHAAKTDEIVHLLEIDELETGKRANQIGTLKRAGDTRWSSHFSSVCSLINMYGATLIVLQKIIVDGSTYSQRGDADSAYNTLTSFEFVLILHLMKDMMGITDILCQALQKQQGRSRHQKDHITVEHYFRVEIFLVTIDKQLPELNSRFNDQAMDLLSLSSTLMPKDAYKNFDIAKISTLVDSYYPEDFTEQEKINLPFQLQHFILDIDSSDINSSSFYSYYRAIIFSNENNKDKVKKQDGG